MNIAEFQFLKAPRIQLIHKEVAGNYTLEVSVRDEFTRFDSQTNTRYHIDYLVGTITRRTKRSFWFGYQTEEIVYHKVPLNKKTEDWLIGLMKDELARMRKEDKVRHG